MPARITNRVRFQVERLVLRGAHYRLLVIAAAIGIIAVFAGLLVYGYSGSFESPAQAIWWAFLRMTDPGYLGDDEGVLLRVVSTVLTVLGFVLFVGALGKRKGVHTLLEHRKAPHRRKRHEGPCERVRMHLWHRWRLRTSSQLIAS